MSKLPEISLAEFVAKNRRLINARIGDVTRDRATSIDDTERELWVLNDEYLYLIAQRANVLL